MIAFKYDFLIKHLAAHNYIRYADDSLCVAYTLFMNGRPAIFCSITFSKKFMLSCYQALQNMLFWEVSAFLVQRRQSYGSFKLKRFVLEMTTRPH